MRSNQIIALKLQKRAVLDNFIEGQPAPLFELPTYAQTVCKNVKANSSVHDVAIGEMNRTQKICMKEKIFMPPN